MAGKRFLKVFIKLALILCVGLGIVVAGALYIMARKDKEHARFFNTGKSVNQFLSNYKHALEDSFKNKDVSEVMVFYSERYASPTRGRWILKPDKTEGDVLCLNLKAEGQQDYHRENLREELDAYLKNLDSVDDIKFKIDMIEKVELERKVQLSVKFILDGKDQQGTVFQDRYFYRWYLENEGSSGGYDWKIVRDELVEGVRVDGNGRTFDSFETEKDLAAIGIDYKHARDPKLDIKGAGAKLKFGVIEHAMGGVSAVDYDNDGRPDLFFADGVRSRLYRNDGAMDKDRVHFTDVTRESQLDGIDQACAGIFADIDNDGFQDLFVTRYMAAHLFYHNNGDGTFTNKSVEMGFDPKDQKNIAPTISACFLDFDRDGFVDLYVGLYGDAFHAVPRLPFLARNGGSNRLYRNNGGRGFTDVTLKSGTGDTGWTLAVAAGDYDNDGYPDIAVANDFGRKNLYHNNGDGTFTEAAKQAGVLDFSGGMGVTFGDFDDDGYLDLYTSNINSNQRWFGEDMTVNQYIRNILRTKWAVYDASEYVEVYRLLGPQWIELGKMSGHGNALFHNNGDGTFRELKDSHTNRAGWGWSVAFFDYDNDADLDIYAANGWISNTPNTDL